MEKQKQYEVLTTQALEAQRLRDMAAQMEERLEKRLGEMVYANGLTPEFLQLCADQAKEQRVAGRLAIASALERYVESKR